MEKKNLLIIFLSLFFSFPFFSQAASLSFSPASFSVKQGDTFTLSILTDSEDQSLNAVSGTVSFSWNVLDVVSVSKTGSVVKLWAEEPSFSNGDGTVSFEGIVPNPGFIGRNGKIVNITFKAEKTGTANLSFSSGSILANDGSGTNILSTMRVATVTVNEKKIIEESAKQESVISGSNSLSIKSTTHPDSSLWYPNNTPSFTWILPNDAIEVRTKIDQSPNSIPNVLSSTLVSTKKFDETKDGIHYFHVQARTSSGWGDVSHFKIQIDTIPPKPFEITFPNGDKTFEPQPVILFNTKDQESGISHYDIKIGDGEPEKILPLALSNPYPLPSQYPGNYTVSVYAYDLAGNHRVSSAEFTIDGIQSPTITHYPESLDSGDLLKIRGTTYPNSDVHLYIKEGDSITSEEYTKSNSLGDFSLVVAKRLDSGIYTVTARVIDGRGAQSNETDPVTIDIRSRIFSRFFDIVVEYVVVVFMVLLFLGLVILTAVHFWFKMISIVRRLRESVVTANKTIDNEFSGLHKRIEKHIECMKKEGSKRSLTTTEKDFLKDFEQEIEDAKNNILKDVKNITKQKK